jgi:hypothetical protein
MLSIRRANVALRKRRNPKVIGRCSGICAKMSCRDVQERCRGENFGESFMKRGHFVGTLAAVLLCTGAAHAQDVNVNFLLKGTFSVTATQTCLQTTGGFNADLTPNAFSFISTTTSVGTEVFNGDGTASETVNDVSVAEPPVADASSDTVSFNFTYQVNADHTLSAAVDGPVTGQSLTGATAGQTFSP